MLQDDTKEASGVGGNISHALEAAKLSEELGADGCLLLPPYLIEPEQEGLAQYLGAIIGSTDLNAIVYQRDNCVLQSAALRRLLEYPQLVGLNARSRGRTGMSAMAVIRPGQQSGFAGGNGRLSVLYW